MTTVLRHPIKHPALGQTGQAGQSLMEFVLVMPLMVLILVGGFSFGMGTYDAHMASDAIQLPALQKMDMAKTDTAIDPGKLMGYVSSGGTSGTLTSGSLLDSINEVDVDNYTSVMVGSKSFVPLASFIPGFTIKTAEVMNKGLLNAASTGGATSRDANTPWVPGGSPVKPPWI